METSLQKKMLRMIAFFEGSANGRINTYDEQLLSLGTLHYAVGQGSGSRFLMRVYQLDPAGTLACLGPQFVDAIKRGHAAIYAFCKVNIWKTGTKWQAAFTALSRLSAYQQADMECAQPYLDGAKALARRYGLVSERGLAWALDRCVQQGPKARPYVDSTYAALGAQVKADEQAVMCALAKAYAATANPTYRNTVQRRSLTVARGNSANTGYPGDVNVERDYGLSLNRPWDAPCVFLRVGQSNTQWDGVEGGAYLGQPLTRAWVAQMQTVYPPGTKTTLTTPTGQQIGLEVYADGALQLSGK